jgi:hypothetical protein
MTADVNHVQRMENSPSQVSSEVWDTPGQITGLMLNRRFLSAAGIIVIVLDQSDRMSLDTVANDLRFLFDPQSALPDLTFHK